MTTANTGWHETIDTPPRQIVESAIYGAAGIAQHAGITRLLLERGVDPNRMTPWSHSALVKAPLDAGASLDGVGIPTGYDEVDALLRRAQ